MIRKLLLVACLTASPATAEVTLHPLFTDGAVLQRGQPITVRGTAPAGMSVTVTFDQSSASATASADGLWQARFPALPAGGTHSIAARGSDGSTAAARDLLIGDVWLCAGQSNMELPVRRALNADSEFAAAADPEVRLFTAPQATAFEPQAAFAAPVAWQPLTSDTIREFSASCWFMVRDLRRTQRVPVGAIDVSWGGSRVRTWTEAGAAQAGGSAADAALLALFRRDRPAAYRQFGETFAAWWREQSGDAPGQEPWHASERLSWRPFPEIGAWDRWQGTDFASFNGLVWARKRVTLTAAQAAQAATLSLGVIDDLDQTFVNGVAVGNTYSWSVPRDYALPAGTLRAGTNEIMVAVYDSYGAGGVNGPAERLRLTLADGGVVPLGEGWQYAMPARQPPFPPRSPWDSHAGVSMMYNAIIAPLGALPVTGIAWYQGESDVGVAGYDQRLAAMMGSWRRQFARSDLPFLIVSLANYGPTAAQPVASGWAELREAQRRAVLADPHAALVVAMDLGDPRDIHPANKQELGRRLARAARALAYGGREPVGPQIVSARREGGAVVLRFSGVTGAFKTLSGARALAFELCGDMQDSCRWADAAAAGSEVRLDDDGRPATRVRYGWADSPVTNLYDAADLPPGPFEVRIGE